MNKATCERPKCVENYGKFFQKYHRAIIDKGYRKRIVIRLRVNKTVKPNIFLKTLQ